MKRLYIILFCLAALQTTQAQISYDVTLEESTITGKAYLVSMEDHTLIDSTEVQKNGTIHFRGKTAMPVMACISSNTTLNGSTCMLVLDDKTLKMEKAENGTMNLKKASKWNKDFQALLTSLKETGSRNVPLIQEYNSLAQKGNIPDSAVARIKKERDAIKADIRSIMRNGLTANKDNIIPVLLLQQGLEDIGIGFAEKFLADYPYKKRPSLKGIHPIFKRELFYVITYKESTYLQAARAAQAPSEVAVEIWRMPFFRQSPAAKMPSHPISPSSDAIR